MELWQERDVSLLEGRDFCFRSDGDGVDHTLRSGGVDGSGGSDVFRSSAGGLLRSVFIMVECGIFELEVLWGWWWRWK